jgi:hypothetical protein
VTRKTTALTRPALAWLSLVLAAGAPAAAMMLWGEAAAPGVLTRLGGPLLAVGLMGAGMIGAAIAGRLRIGIALALLNGAGLLLLAQALGLPLSAHPLATGLACAIASLSFAARGALFARSGGAKGWVIALAVVAGEGAMLLTALASPDALPRWLLVLLPAQWASMAIQTALAGKGTLAAFAPLLALGGTAITTLLAAHLWPRRWPYLVMFSTWLGLSALVWHW